MSLEYRKIKGVLTKDYTRFISIKPNTKLVFRRISLDINGLLTILRYYVWDYASGALDTKSIIEGSLVHDGLCELMLNRRLPLSCWDEAAEVMKEVNLSKPYPMMRPRAWWVCRATKIAGPDVLTKRKIITL